LAKSQMHSGISRRNDDAHGIVEREFAELIYGKDNSYGWRFLDGDLRGLQSLQEREVRYGALRYFAFRDYRLGRIWLLDFEPELVPLTQMRFDLLYQNGRYLIVRSPPPGRLDEGLKPLPELGPDPRAYMGVDPVLRQALRTFAARERGENS